MLLFYFLLSVRFLAVLEIKSEQLKNLIVWKIFSYNLLFLHSCLVHSQFMDLSSVNELFNSSYSDQSVYNNISLLPDSVYSVDCLIIISRIPVRIKNNDSISAN